MHFYKNILIYGATCFILANLLFIIAFVFSNKKQNHEKVTAYECGFEAFDDSKMNHDIHFFITAVSFLILDLETMYLFP
jgi:NADH-quinone oxidoreductase subunit A